MPGKREGEGISIGGIEIRETTRVHTSEIEHLARHPYPKRHDRSLQCGRCVYVCASCVGSVFAAWKYRALLNHYSHLFVCTEKNSCTRGILFFFYDLSVYGRASVCVCNCRGDSKRRRRVLQDHAVCVSYACVYCVHVYTLIGITCSFSRVHSRSRNRIRSNVLRDAGGRHFSVLLLRSLLFFFARFILFWTLEKFV